MNIKVSDLKRFQSLSSHIQGAGILPIHEYLKFGNGMIQKEVSQSFIKFDCAEAVEELLVHEQDLFNLVRATPSDVITITGKKDKTTLYDKRDTIPMKVPETKLFVDINTGQLDRLDISEDFLAAIGSAAKVCQPMGSIPDKYMYVMVGKKCVTGISISYGFCRPIQEEFTMVLEKKTAVFVSKTGAKQCSISGSHHIFYTDDATIGFAIHELGYGDFGSTLRNNPGELTFTASNSDIRSYNSLAMSLFKTLPQVAMTTRGTLEVYDSNVDKGQARSVAGLTPYEEFLYVPSYMNEVLDALDTEELDFYQKPNMLIIKSRDTNAVAAIGKISK